jgi:prepilin-type N-terminal cleavage/methylation domain-containing protein/prepilin-type processing-associated H-X9-DG protein
MTFPNGRPIRRKLLSGFTLIELLVVIAIIAILASILFPVFAQAREKARATQCLSNTKQIGLGIQQYTQDWDEMLPGRQWPTKSGNWPYPQIADIIQPYTKSGGRPSPGDSAGRGGIWQCPSAQNPQQNWQIGVNASMFPDGEAPWNDLGGYDNKGNYVSLAMIDRPADIIGFVDKGANSGRDSWMEFTADQWGYTDSGVCASGSGANCVINEEADAGKVGEGALVENKGDCDLAAGGQNWNWARSCFIRPRYRHNGVTNATFLDGHAKAMRKGQIRYSKNLHVQAVHGELW